MNGTKVKIVEAAIDAFTKGGVRGTNMSAIAAAARVSRQTLYAYFDTKDALLAAVMQHYVVKLLRKLEERWAESETVSKKIDVFFDLVIVEPFEVLQVHPDLKDLLLGVGSRTADVAQQADTDKTAALVRQLEPLRDELDRVGSTPETFGDFLTRVAIDLKYSCATREELDRRLALLKHSALALIDKAS